MEIHKIYVGLIGLHGRAWKPDPTNMNAVLQIKLPCETAGAGQHEHIECSTQFKRERFSVAFFDFR